MLEAKSDDECKESEKVPHDDDAVNAAPSGMLSFTQWMSTHTSADIVFISMNWFHGDSSPTKMPGFYCSRE